MKEFAISYESEVVFNSTFDFRLHYQNEHYLLSI